MVHDLRAIFRCKKVKMFEQEIERKINDFRALGIPEYISRDAQLTLVPHMVSTVIGARRAGKSFRVLQSIDDSVGRKIIPSKDHVCYIDFDNPILADMHVHDLQSIQSVFLKLNPKFNLKTSILFILDEIHKIQGWEKYVIDLSRNSNWKVVVTGSSSRMMKKDISTELRGKAIPSEIFPLSFSEFLKFKKFSHNKSSTKGIAEIKRFFDEYIKWGSYPAIPDLSDFQKELVLREYFESMILSDIITRYNVSKPRQCVHLCQYLMSNISRAVTLQSSYEFLKQAGFKTSRDSIREYIEWGEDAWLYFIVPIYSTSNKEQERNYKKIYSIDWALANKNSLVWDGSHSRSLENIIYIHLKQKWPRVFFYLTREKRKEIDFLVVGNNGKPYALIQVCMDLSDKHTLQRELDPLIASAKYFGTKYNFIITLNEEKCFQEQNIRINAMPAWKFLININGLLE